MKLKQTKHDLYMLVASTSLNQFEWWRHDN